MFTYIAAIATAATLCISPMSIKENTVAKASQTPAKTAITQAYAPRITAEEIEVHTTPTAYHLSKQEQSVMRAALLRTVKIVHPGVKTA